MRKLFLLFRVLVTYRSLHVWFAHRWGWLARGTDCTVRLWNGLQFRVRPELNELGTVDDIFVRGEYKTAAYTIGEGAIVLDIGANIGAFSLFAAHRGARVYAYEPTPGTYARLRKNIELNNVTQRVTALQNAVAGNAGKRELFLHPAVSGANTIAPYREHLDFVESGKGVLVEAVTLDDVFKANGIGQCDFLKLDCEGAEFEILRAASRETLARIRHIAMEYHRDPAELRRILRAAGFEVVVRPTDGNSGFLFADK